MFLQVLKNSVCSGAAIGVMAGIGSNLYNGGSLFRVNSSLCKKPFTGLNVLTWINNYRENDFKSVILSSLYKPTLFNPFLPLIHLVPPLGFIVWNIVSQCKNSDNFRVFLKKQAIFALHDFIAPVIHSTALLIGSIFCRALIAKPASKFGIDISIHIITQAPLGYMIWNNKNAMPKIATPIQLKFYSLIVLVIEISDAIWVYNTAANCHSVLEVAFGVAIVALVHLGIKRSEESFHKGLNYISNKCKINPCSLKALQV